MKRKIKQKNKIIIGADHAGYYVKKLILKYFEKQKIPYDDIGGYNPDSSDDYPDIAKKLSRKVVKQKTKGILICGAGIGMAMAANKVKGARAGLCFDVYSAKMSREHNDANVLALRARKFPQKKILPIVRAWLNTPFSNKPRHKRRIKKIE